MIAVSWFSFIIWFDAFSSIVSSQMTFQSSCSLAKIEVEITNKWIDDVDVTWFCTWKVFVYCHMLFQTIQRFADFIANDVSGIFLSQFCSHLPWEFMWLTYPLRRKDRYNPSVTACFKFYRSAGKRHFDPQPRAQILHLDPKQAANSYVNNSASFHGFDLFVKNIIFITGHYI